MQTLNIVELIETNPICKLSSECNNKLLTKITEKFTNFEQQMFISSFYCYLNYDKTVDFVFEDSVHTIETLTHALPFWWERLAIGGILAGHDYTMQEVKTSVDTFSVLNNLKVNLFANSSIWYIKK